MCIAINNVVILLFASKVFVWIGKEARDEEKTEAVASGMSLTYVVYKVM